MIYGAIKTLVTNENYQYDDMMNKMDLFLLANRITEAQYVELKTIMDKQHPEKAEQTA